MEPLTERQQVERAWYDSFYSELAEATPDERLRVDPDRPPIYFAGMEGVVRRAISSLGPLEGRKLLVVGCGHGAACAWLSLHGARVWAVDVSEAAIRMTERAGRLNGVSERISAHCMPAEDLAVRFEAGAFDLAYGTEVLHHLDLERFAPSLRAVLRAEARAAFIEPLAASRILHRLREGWPVRRLLPVYRHTPTETMLTDRSLGPLAQSFHVERHDFSAITFLVGIAQRYRRLGAIAYRMAGVGELPKLAAMEAFSARVFELDERLLRRLPPLRALCRKSVIFLSP